MNSQMVVLEVMITLFSNRFVIMQSCSSVCRDCNILEALNATHIYVTAIIITF